MKLENSLKNFGFTDKEASVYIACLEIGNGTALKIAGKAGLPKSTTHDILKNLNSRGFVSVYTKKNRKYFAASDPKILEKKTKDQIEELNSLLPKLSALYNSKDTKPSVRFYEERKGIESAFSEMFTEADKLLYVGSVDRMFAVFPEYFPKAVQERVGRGIRSQTIVEDGPMAREYIKSDKEQMRESKLIKPERPFETMLWIWNNKITFFNTSGKSSVFIIEDTAIANFMRSMFGSVWKNEPDVRKADSV